VTGGRIGVGLVGLGNSGWYYHAEGTLERSHCFELVAVSARTPERTAVAAARFGARAHPDWESLVADDRVEVVVVATPHDLHAPIAIRALEAGRHVVVEKPMAMTRSETDAMIAAATASGRLLTVFQNRRWEPSFQLIRRLVADGEIGDVWRVEERRMHRGKYTVAGKDRPHAGAEPAAWAHGTATGGGVTYLIAPHLVDHQLLLHGGLPETVSAVMHTFPGDAVEHYVDLRLGFPGDRQARIEIFRENVVDLPKWSVFGDAGTIVCPDFDRLVVQPADGARREYAGLAPLQSCDAFYDGLARALREGEPPPVDAHEAAEVVAVLEAAHRSARGRGASIRLGQAGGAATCSAR
jgi:scyllo-inositol 2-dehydrogenase (NADP+)